MYKSQWREPLLYREYLFLAAENTWYLMLSSKTKGHANNEQNMSSSPSSTRESQIYGKREFPILDTAWQMRKINFKQAKTVILLSPQKQNKVISYVAR